MKKLFLLIFAVIAASARAQLPAITDTIQASSWEDAMDRTFGLLPAAHYPSGYLFDKVAAIPKLPYADGTLNDSTFNMPEFYFIENYVRMSYIHPDSLPGYDRLDSLKEEYIRENDILPFGMIDILGHKLKPDAFQTGALTVAGYRITENSVDLSAMYTTQQLFCVSPLNVEIYTLSPSFILKPEFTFSNNANAISSIDIDLDDGLGFRTVEMNTPFSASYLSGGYKIITTQVTYTTGEKFFSRSELSVVDNSTQSMGQSGYEPYDEVYPIYPYGPSANLGSYPDEFSVPFTLSDHGHSGRFVEVGVWYGCGNTSKKLRKPYIIFGGYNPKDGKALQANTNAPWVNNTFGAVLALEGWRGPLYETYNGFFTDGSKNAPAQAFGSNGNNLLDKIRKEGYDVIIVRFHDGIGYIQNNAFLVSLVLKDINQRILNEADNIENPGAALDPEAPGYPFSTKVKKAKHELIVSGYSAGALSSRLGLLLMEFEHEKYKCNLGDIKKTQSTVHRTRIWIGVDHETQGSNTPIGQQMFMDFEESLMFFPANAGDIVNSLICKKALELLGENGIATQNTLYHIGNTFHTGGSNWSVGPHSDFYNYYNDLSAVTPGSYPANLKGYPKNCYRISVSQGNANGVGQLVSNSTNLIYNESPSSWCVGLVNLPNIFAMVTKPYREATARVLSSWNNEAFGCQFGVSFHTIFYSWHVNLGHFKYQKHNYAYDGVFGGAARNYDEVAASTLPSHIILAKNLMASPNPWIAAFTICNYEEWNPEQHGFCPTVSGLDIHQPGNNTLPRFPNLAMVPGNVGGGLQLMKKNNYNNTLNAPPNNDFGYPHLVFPANHYDYTPFDAIWANTTNNTNYNSNTIHVEDPNPLTGEFLAEEIAPYTLYLSNRTIQADMYACGDAPFKEKYYADFEARNSVLAGDQSIYKHNTQYPYDRVRTEQGDFVVGNGGVVTFRANNYDGQSSVVLGPGFSAKKDCIFRAYVYTDPNTCGPFTYEAGKVANTEVKAPVKEPRPIYTKRASVQKAETENKPFSLSLFPNPTSGTVSYVLDGQDELDYTISDVMGKVIDKGTLKGPLSTIDLGAFEKGVYIITIRGKKYEQTDRVILQ